MRHAFAQPVWFVRAALVVFSMQVAVNAVRPAVSYRALDIGANTVSLGIIAAGFAIFSLLASIPVGRQIDRRGEMPFIILGIVLVSVVSLSLVVINTVWLLFVTQTVLGLGQVLVTIGTQAMIASSAPEGRDRRFSTFTVFVSLGQLLGPAMGGLAADNLRLPEWDAFGFGTHLAGAPAFVIGSVFGLFGMCLALMNRRLGTKPSQEQRDDQAQISAFRGVGAVLRQTNAPQAMFASIAVLTTIDLLVAYLPAYGEETGLSGTTVGMLLTIRAGTSLISRIFLTSMSRLLGRGRLLVLCTLVPALTLAPLVSISAFPLVAVLIAFAGFGLGLGQPLSLIWITETAPKHMRGTAIGVRMSGNRLGQVVVPLLVSGAIGATGVGAVFVAVAVMLAVSSVLTARADFSPPEAD